MQLISINVADLDKRAQQQPQNFSQGSKVVDTYFKM
jgi:hypothetical protein